jgi:hypothetical protein
MQFDITLRSLAGQEDAIKSRAIHSEVKPVVSLFSINEDEAI